MATRHAYVTYGHEHTRVEEYVPMTGSGEPFIVGDFVVEGTSNAAKRAGADPAAGTIIGISEVDSEFAKTLTGNGRVPVRGLFPGAVLAMSSATQYVEATHKNQEYGITRNATTGHWLVDVAKTGGDARVLIVRGDETPNIWYAQVLAEFLALPGIDS